MSHGNKCRAEGGCVDWVTSDWVTYKKALAINAHRLRIAFNMKPFGKALVLAAATEAAVLVALFAFAGIGPCGPSNLAGELFLFYMMPGFWICEALHIGDPWIWLPAVILQTAFWFFVWLGFLGVVRRKETLNAEN